MYQLISAIAKEKNNNKQWVNVELGHVTFLSLYNFFSKIYLTLSNSFTEDPVSLDLDLIRDQTNGLNITVDEYLANLGDQSLPTSNELKNLKSGYVKYSDAFHAGYNIEPVHPTAAPDAALPNSEKPYLRLTKPDIESELFYNHCLVNVNGFFHMIDYDVKSIYVVDGMKSKWLSGQNQIGVMSFKDVGKITYLPITEDMLFKRNNDQLYKNKICIDAKQDISSKSLAVVIGGYLHILDNRAFYRTGLTTINVDTANIPLLHRFYESRHYIDLTSLGLQKSPTNDEQIDVNEFLSDAVLTKYFTLSQSFLVLIDNVDLFTEYVALHKSKMPNKYVSYSPPIYPMLVNNGRIINYWYQFEDQQYSISCHDSLRQYRNFDTISAREEVSVDTHRTPERPVTNPIPHFLKIGTVTI